MGITRAMRRLFISHARTRMLFNNRQANEISRFIGEIPPRLISDVRRQQQPTRIPAAGYGSRTSAGGGYAAGSGFGGANRQPSGGTNPGFGKTISIDGSGKVNIPGVQKGFPGTARTVPSQAAGMAPAVLFREGNRIRHRIFGEGEIIEVREGNRLVIRFKDGQEKIFPANTAPIVRID